MATRGKTKLSKDLGLALGHVAGRYFVGLDELHFGYWPEDLPVTLQNLPRAQEAFSDVVMQRVPSEARAILEVGCGTGRLAERLVDAGHEVEVVSPSSHLTGVARERLGERVRFHECRFEDLSCERRFDLVLFSESFQYVEQGRGLPLAQSLLSPGGRILLCDYFRLSVKERSPIGGGRPFEDFRDQLDASGLKVLEELDLTEHVAPGLALLEDLDRNLIAPGYRAVVATLERERPWLLRFLRWKYERKLARFEQDIASGARTPEAFRRHKTYRLYLLGAP